jgi:hypothetical protein
MDIVELSRENCNYSSISGEETLKRIDVIRNTAGATRYSAIVIKAPTGFGKSTFITKDLYKYCYKNNLKILFLLPRKAPKQQFEDELKLELKNDIIKIATYQQIEQEEKDYLNTSKKIRLSEYDIIVCDEAHYFVQDSVFNPYTYKSWEAIKAADKAVKIFMSATIDSMYDIISGMNKESKCNYAEQWEKRIEVSGNKRLSFLCIDFKDEYSFIEDRLNKLKEKMACKKVIVMPEKVETAFKLYKKFKEDSLFVCSQYNKKYSKYITKDLYNNMLKNQRFDKQFLLCTSALDVGFNIKDPAVKYMICTVRDYDTIMQCIGRKRYIDKDDTMTVLLRNINNHALGGIVSQNKKAFEHYNFFKKYGEEEYLLEYEQKNDMSGILYTAYDDEKNKAYIAVNYMKLQYYIYQKNILQNICNIKAKDKYRRFMRKQLKDYFYCMEPVTTKHEDVKHESNVKTIKNNINVQALQQFADEQRIFTMKDREEIFKVIGYKENGRLVKNVDICNEYLKNNNVFFEIKKITGRKIRFMVIVLNNEE